MNVGGKQLVGLAVSAGLALLVLVLMPPHQLSAPPWVATGEGVNNNFAYSVGTVGDVNGDGFDDVIVGADRYKDFTGRAYVYAGCVDGLSSTPIFTATGETVNNHFGFSVGAAGDVDGDGYDDVIVGAYHYQNFLGRVYVYAGAAAGVRADPLFTAVGESENSYFGRSVGTAGDVNGDGHADVVVGAPAHGDYTGRVYVYAGAVGGPLASPVFTATGEALASAFGRAVGTAGDVNGDGFDDLIVGAPGHGGTGRVYVYAGGRGGLQSAPIFVAGGQTPGDRFGCAVAAAGDVNGDGFHDIIVGADGYNDHMGLVAVYAGSKTGVSATPVFTATGEAILNYFGGAVGGAGDVNGDGVADIVVGANGYRDYSGRAYVYAGGAGGLDATPILTVTGQGTQTWLGKSVGSAGDVNGDGHDQIMVGAYGFGDWTGRAYVFEGSAGDGR
jgi:hypothetical protein